MLQHELFNESQAGLQGKRVTSFFSENKLVIGFDKVILLSIGCLILFVLVYSFGFERGRRAAEHHFKALTGNVETIPLMKAPQPTVATPSETLPIRQETLSDEAVNQRSVDAIRMTIKSTAPAEITPNTGKYTIQVATILSREKADKEIDRLKRKGFEAFVIERGRFFEVCIGSYPSLTQAKSLLRQFHHEGPYFDAFLRPNPNYMG
ncbi:MAG: hypothetical protein COV74_05430 [Candidatus Omnitrophica bacterium CG11_big_fil_rev_8_21_14_0_20_45_26]|uniref:SPOR domain-containing protein n=1 Tax=Candidatus Abzuiibacterium crystallinum TaxID=1974748 RepID=A0A2H0LPK1_9BACT|nr:MAG: hypothetical protein COV74_05430 [Candidatus Omnitrophica bacterium CG11_big_fil_rev_8_21_14_0_20_45_26]PIW64332.1 MAG: hypothetical protein COW12_06750 [Candidatus Omnitrophica bacterium CG12_big_fil_rev_8_21_14_0_65_45_16]